MSRHHVVKQTVPASGRRSLMTGLLSAGALLATAPGPAWASLRAGALGTPAIAVKSPANALLIAITKAGNRLVAVGDHGVILFSDDKGASWIQASVPVDAALTCVAFITPQIGWAAGHYGVILNTVDGGKSWKIQLTGDQAIQLTLQAAQDPALATSPSPGAPIAMARARHFLAEGNDKPFLSILPISPQRIIAFGAYRMTMLSDDGGKNWKDWSLHIYDRYSQNLYAATVLGTDIYVAGETGLVFRSQDDGATFPEVTSPSSTTLFGVIGADDGGVIVFGVVGDCFRSSDQGKTWNAITVNTQDNLTAARRLGSGEILLASESGQLFLSRDNGQSFNTVNQNPRGAIFDFEFIPGTGVIAVGNSGVFEISQTVVNS